MFKAIKSLLLISLMLTSTLAQGNGETALTAGTESTQAPMVNTKLQDFIETHADEIKAEPDIDVNYCLQQLTGTTYGSEYGQLVGELIDVGCMHGLELCDTHDLYGIEQQLRANGIDGSTIKQISILIGGMIGSSIAGSGCDGVPECESIGGKIGATLTCLSVSKELFQAMTTAVSTLKNIAKTTGEIAQDTADAITNAAKATQTGVQDAIDQINQGGGDAVSALKGVTNQVGQSFTDLGNEIAGGLTAAGKAIGDAGQQAVGAVGDAAQQAVGAVGDVGQQAVGAVGDAGQQAVAAVGDAGQQAVGALEGAGEKVASGFCGIFGC